MTLDELYKQYGILSIQLEAVQTSMADIKKLIVQELNKANQIPSAVKAATEVVKKKGEEGKK